MWQSIQALRVKIMSPFDGTQQKEKMTLDGQEVSFATGETIYEVSQRHQKNIPTLVMVMMLLEWLLMCIVSFSY